jgi:hypothetical protein
MTRKYGRIRKCSCDRGKKVVRRRGTSSKKSGKKNTSQQGRRRSITKRRTKKNKTKRGKAKRGNSRRAKRCGGKMKGGAANALPTEYYGGKSGRYFENPNDIASHDAYGDYVGQSYGMPFSQDASGPNLYVHPASPTGNMTDGF